MRSRTSPSWRASRSALPPPGRTAPIRPPTRLVPARRRRGRVTHGVVRAPGRSSRPCLLGRNLGPNAVELLLASLGFCYSGRLRRQRRRPRYRDRGDGVRARGRHRPAQLPRHLRRGAPGSPRSAPTLASRRRRRATTELTELCNYVQETRPCATCSPTVPVRTLIEVRGERSRHRRRTAQGRDQEDLRLRLRRAGVRLHLPDRSRLGRGPRLPGGARARAGLRRRVLRRRRQPVLARSARAGRAGPRPRLRGRHRLLVAAQMVAPNGHVSGST